MSNRGLLTVISGFSRPASLSPVLRFSLRRASCPRSPLEFHNNYQHILIDDYDYIVVNENADICAQDIHRIICNEHKKVANNSEFINKIKQDFKNIK